MSLDKLFLHGLHLLLHLVYLGQLGCRLRLLQLLLLLLFLYLGFAASAPGGRLQKMAGIAFGHYMAEG